MKVTIDEDKCVACGQCVAVAPDVFDQRDEDGIVILLDENPPVERAPTVREAAAVCPALVITVVESPPARPPRTTFHPSKETS
ncbi:ferredoxin [Nocardia sp. 2YAB30]|uniref:ferredoxin n=1 Tax=unclassified Nocardia TaxID=2637762 RepID=UPI003F99C93F